MSDIFVYFNTSFHDYKKFFRRLALTIKYINYSKVTIGYTLSVYLFVYKLIIFKDFASTTKNKIYNYIIICDYNCIIKFLKSNLITYWPFYLFCLKAMIGRACMIATTYNSPCKL